MYNKSNYLNYTAYMDDIESYQIQINLLEAELDEMTVALSQAWDQLVPLLQKAPPTNSSSVDVVATLQAIMAALDVPLSGIFLVEDNTWFTLPSDIALPTVFFDWLKDPVQPLYLSEHMIWQGIQTQWLFMPIIPEAPRMAGAIGVGIDITNRHFTALEERILARMTERMASQMVAASLAQSRKWEAQTRRDLQIASLIQRSIQPTQPPQIATGWRMEGMWEPAKTVGGDAWGWVMQPDGQLACFLLDVTGKGLPAALAAVALHTALRMTLRLGYSPIETLRVINAEFYDAYSQSDLLATVVVIALDPNTGELTQANAGHPPTLIRHKREWTTLASTAPPLGALPEIHLKPQQVALSGGDIVVCYSDGFSEIETEEGLWGTTGLIDVLTRKPFSQPQEVIRTITSKALELQNQAEAHDDQTLLVIMRQGKEMLKTQVIPADLGELAQLPLLLESLLNDITPEVKITLELAVQELCVNIVVHAYGDESGVIEVQMQREGEDLFLTFRDYAPNSYTLPQEIVAPDPLDLPEGGWGIYLIYNTVDHVEYQRLSDGNWWRLYKNLEGNHVS